MDKLEKVKPHLEKVTPALKMVAPTLQKQGANYLADYLNQRRRKKLGLDAKPETDPEPVATPTSTVSQTSTVPSTSIQPVSQHYLASEAKPVKQSPWIILFTTLIGSSLGVVIGAFLVKKGII